MHPYSFTWFVLVLCLLLIHVNFLIIANFWASVAYIDVYLKGKTIKFNVFIKAWVAASRLALI